MEAGQLPLEESLSAYQRGVELLQHCQRQLADAEEKVRVLDNGTPPTGRRRACLNPTALSQDFSDWMRDVQGRTESALPRMPPAAESIPARLHQAMRYSTLGAASACARCSPSPRAITGATPEAPRRCRLRRRMHPRLFAGPRRPALAWTTILASRPPDLPCRIR